MPDPDDSDSKKMQFSRFKDKIPFAVSPITFSLPFPIESPVTSLMEDCMLTLKLWTMTMTMIYRQANADDMFVMMTKLHKRMPRRKVVGCPVPEAHQNQCHHQSEGQDLPAVQGGRV